MQLQNYPYVEECNVCKVCIPEEVVAHHPKAQERIKHSKYVHHVTIGDDDVEVEDDDGEPGTVTAATKRLHRRLKQLVNMYYGREDDSQSHGQGSHDTSSSMVQATDSMDPLSGYYSHAMPRQQQQAASIKARRALLDSDEDYEQQESSRDEVESDGIYHIKVGRWDWPTRWCMVWCTIALDLGGMEPMGNVGQQMSSTCVQADGAWEQSVCYRLSGQGIAG